MAKRIEIQILGDASNLSRALKDAGGHTSRFGSALGSLAKAGVLAAGAAGLGAVFVTLRSGIKEWSESAKVTAQTEAVIKSTGNTANVTAKGIAAMSEALMRKSSVDDEAIQAGANMLLTFTKIRNEVGAGNDIFTQATKATLDLSVALGKDMPDAALLVGKALNMPLQGMTALQRAGIQFTDAQKESIKAMVESGNIMGAQKLILAELTTQFGGSAVALGSTLPGKIAILKESFNNLAGSIVGSLAPAFATALTKFNEFFAKFSTAQGFTAKLNVVWTGLSEAATSLIGRLRTEIMGEWVRGPKMEVGGELMVFKAGLAQEIGAKLAVIDWKTVGTSVATALSDALAAGGDLSGRLVVVLSKGFKKAVSEIDWSTVGGELAKGLATGTADLETQLKTGFGPRIGKAIVSGVKAGMPGGGKILDLLPLLEDEAKAAIAPATAGFKPVGAGVKKGIGQGIEGTAAQVGQRMTTVMATAGRFIGAFQGVGLGLGTALGSGIKSGLESALSGLGAAMVAKVNAAVAQAKAAAEVGSPSKLTEREIGKPLGQGVIDGWIKSTATLPEKMSATLKAAIEKARAAIEAARDRLGTVFDGLTSRILRAFDAESAGFETTHEKILREIDERRQMEDLVQRQADAQIRLNEAIKEGDAAAIAAAQRDLTRATEDIARVDIEAKAAEERKNLDSLREEQRIHLEKKLAALEASFVKEGASVKKAMAAMAKLMASFGIDFESAGALVGEAFVAGLRASLGAAASAAAGVGRAVPGPSSFSGGGVAAAGAGTIVFNNYAPINSQQQLDDQVQAAAARLRNSGRLPV